MNHLHWLDPHLDPLFPSIHRALNEPSGLLAVGGALTTPWLLEAYRHGIFPWFNDGEPILWWSPTPRMVMLPGMAHRSRTLRKLFRASQIEITVNHCFEQVMHHCAQNDLRNDGTWITRPMKQGYLALHRDGWAHSIEVHDRGQLVGGLYGVAIDRVFFGESMFSLSPSASKFAFVALSEWTRQQGMALIDCQLYNPYLDSLGAQLVDRPTFESNLPRTLTRLAMLDPNVLQQLFEQKMRAPHDDRS